MAFDWGSIISALPSIVGGTTKLFGDLSTMQYGAEAAEQKRQDDLFLTQIGLMKDLATIPGGSSSRSWQEGGTGYLTDAQRLASMRQSSIDKINQLNNLVQNYQGALR